MTIDDFLTLLSGVKKSGGGGYYRAFVPGDPGRTRDLSIWEKNGWIWFRDFTGKFDRDQILGTLGLTVLDLKTTGKDSVYTYKNERGEETFRKIIRQGPLDPKKIVRQMGASGETNLEHLGPASKDLYKLPDVIWAAKHGKPLVINPGESACNAVKLEWQMVATCQPGGEDECAGKWLERHTAAIRGCSPITIVADRDKVGASYAKHLFVKLRDAGIEASVVSSATTGEHDDCHDHILAGFTFDELVLRPELMPTQMDALGLTRMDTVEPREVDWLWYPYLPKRYMTLLEGDGDVGKSYACAAIVAALSRGELPMGAAHVIDPVNCLLLMSEDDAEDTIAPRLIENRAERSRIFHHPHLWAFDKAGLERLDELMRVTKAAIVVIDPILGYMAENVNINQANAVRPIFNGLKDLAIKHNAVIINIRHTGKDSKDKEKHHGGLGSVDIRNVHRSQLVVSWHPEKKGLRLIRHMKHNLSREGDVFGYEFRDDSFCWNWKPPIDDESQGPSPSVQVAMKFCEKHLTGQYIGVKEFISMAAKAGIREASIKRARAELNVKTVKSGPDGGWLLHLPDVYDPFTDE